MKFKVDIGLNSKGFLSNNVISFYDYCDCCSMIVDKIESGTSDFVSFYGAHDGVRRDSILWYKIWRLDG